MRTRTRVDVLKATMNGGKKGGAEGAHFRRQQRFFVRGSHAGANVFLDIFECLSLRGGNIIF